MSDALAIYVAGVIVGVAAMRDRWPTRLGIALVWPLGPLAFLVVFAVMLVAAAVLWPLLLGGLAAAIVAIVWLVW